MLEKKVDSLLEEKTEIENKLFNKNDELACEKKKFNNLEKEYD